MFKSITRVVVALGMKIYLWIVNTKFAHERRKYNKRKYTVQMSITYVVMMYVNQFVI